MEKYCDIINTSHTNRNLASSLEESDLKSIVKIYGTVVAYNGEPLARDITQEHQTSDSSEDEDVGAVVGIIRDSYQYPNVVEEPSRWFVRLCYFIRACMCMFV